jgi:hypothetical protein
MVVYACGMQSKVPFLFSMPPLFAWPLAVGTSTVLILAVFLVFVEPAAEGEGPTEAPAEATQSAEAEAAETPAPAQSLSSAGQTVLIGLLIVSVGLIPMMARRKRMKAIWWSLAGLGTGFMHILLGGLPLVHPLMVLLALVYIRPQPPAAPAAPPDMRSPEARDAGPVAAPAPVQASSAPQRRRLPRRRRRPRF